MVYNFQGNYMMIFYDQPRHHIKKQRHYLVNKGLSSQGYGFSSGHVWMWELDYKESWAPKHRCFWTVVLEKTLESPLDCKEIQPVYPKGDQSWVFIGRTDVEAETPVLWPPDVKSWLIWKHPDAGKDWGQEEKGTTEDEMAGWHHWLNGLGFGWTQGVGDGQGRPGVLDLKEAEEPEIKFSTSIGSQKKQGNSRKASTSASLTTLKLLIMWITTNCGKFFKRWES